MVIGSPQLESTLGGNSLGSGETPPPPPPLELIPGELGRIVLVESFTPTPDRTSRLVRINRDGFNHAAVITDPAGSRERKFNVAVLPGYTERVEPKGITSDFEAQVAKVFPEARTIVLGTDGIGKTGSHVTPRSQSKHGIKSMAESRLDILSDLCEDEPVLVVGTSMGTVISKEITTLNGSGRVQRPLNIIGNVHVASALVDPKRVIPDMVLRFPTSLPRDELRNLPKHALVSLEEVTEHTRSLATTIVRYLSIDTFFELPALTTQAHDLLKGTPESEIEESVKAYPTIVISGERDPLIQQPMWQEFEAGYPDNVRFVRIPGFGHDITAWPVQSSNKIRKEVDKFGILS